MEQYTDALIIEQLVKTSTPGSVALRFTVGVDAPSHISFNRETKKWDLFTNTEKREFLDLDYVLQYLRQYDLVDDKWVEDLYAKIDKIYFATVPNSELKVTYKAKSSFWDRFFNKSNTPKITLEPVYLAEIRKLDSLANVKSMEISERKLP